METLIQTIMEYAPVAHYLIFGLLMLAGLNVPISEDVMLLLGGIIASVYIPENTYLLFLWLYLGCIFSAWEAYWLGRLIGPKIFRIRWFNRFFNEKKMGKLALFYEKYGLLTFFVGRFIPGGVRNGLFMTAGMGYMHFGWFVLRDSIACLFSTATLFYLGFVFGEHHEQILSLFMLYQKWAIFALALLGIFLIFTQRVPFFRRKKSQDVENIS